MPDLDETVSTLIRPEIRALCAYSIPDSSDLTKLDAMENPYAWPKDLVSEWLEVLKDVSINRYPDPDPELLKQKLKENMEIPGDMQIMLGNGSDEIIQIILMAVYGAAKAVISPRPSFVMYDMISTFTGMRFVSVPVTDDFELDPAAMKKAINEHDPAVVFIAYPNNPTGNLFKRQDIVDILEMNKGLIVIDEAYHAFAEQSFMQELSRYDNLLVMRTVSKMGLAGLRLGLLAGHEKWISEFNKIRLPYNINVLTQKSAEFAFNHYAMFAEQTRNICRDRDQMYDQLAKISGLTVYPSKANFILFKVPTGQSQAIFNSLKSQGILIKNMGASTGVLKDCLRVTVGTPAENKLFFDAISVII